MPVYAKSQVNSRRRNRASHIEKRVDHVVLAHKDCTEKIGYNDEAELFGVCIAPDKSCDENRHIRDKNNPKEAAIQGKYLVAQIAESASIGLFWEDLVLIALPRKLMTLFDG